MIRRAMILVAVMLITTTAWAQAPATQKSPTTLGSVRALKDLEYVPNGHERQRLDLYLPADSSKPLPVIIWVHGGGWTNGDKANCPAKPLVGKGYAVAAINYRFSQHAIFPAQIQDCKTAVRWLRAHAGKYGLNRSRFGAWGSSAGGHLVALMGLTDGVKEFEGDTGNADQSSRVQAVVDWFGPTNFLTAGAKDTRTNLLGGDPQKIRDKALKASPITYVSKNAPPFLIMHGDADQVVPIGQSEILAKGLQAAGADVTFVIIPGAGHGGLKFRSPETLKVVEEFFQRHLKDQSPLP